MGFFKKLFKRKKGGTFFGNLLRKVSNKASGGILGNGDDLRAWEAKQAPQTIPAQAVTLSKQAKTVMESVHDATAPPKVSFADKAKVFFKKYWYIPTTLVLLIIGLIVYKKRTPTKKKY
jgi:ABC-type phosphate transport system auxiliary subunit